MSPTHGLWWMSYLSFDIGELINGDGEPLLDFTLFEENGFSFGGFQSSIVGESFTLDTSAAEAIFPTSFMLWNDASNWRNGTIGDNGLDVVFDLSNATSAVTEGFVSMGSNSFEVADITIGAGVTLQFGTSATLTQVSSSATAEFSNAGEINLIGTLNTLTDVISGGGNISMNPNGRLNANGPGGLTLRGQNVRGAGATITVQNKLDLDSRSSVGFEDIFGNSAPRTTLTVMNDQASTNRGRIYADDGFLDWNAAVNGEYVIDNRFGLIEAVNNGTVIIAQTGPAGTGIRLLGGTLKTDFNSVIQFRDETILEENPVFAGNGTLRFLDDVTLRNDLESNVRIEVSRDLIVESPFESNITGFSSIEMFDGKLQANTFRLILGDDVNVFGSGEIDGQLGSQLTLLGSVFATRNEIAFDIPVVFNRGSIGSNGGDVRINSRLNNTDAIVFTGGGDVDINGTLDGGDGDGPGGSWQAFFGQIRLNDGVNQWRSLTRDHALLDGGEIILGSPTGFLIDGKPLNTILDEIGSDGSLTLLNQIFNRFSIVGGQRTTETIDIAGSLNLNNATIDTGSFFDPVSLNILQGALRVADGGSISGSGRINSHVFNEGNVTAQFLGNLTTISGGVFGAGRYAAEGGAGLQALATRACGQFADQCLAVRASGGLGAAGTLRNSSWRSDGTELRPSTIKLGGLSTGLIERLDNAHVELEGEGSRFLMSSSFGLVNSLSSVTGVTLETALSQLDNGSSLHITDGRQYLSDRTFRVDRGSALRVTGESSRYEATDFGQILVDSTSRVDLEGGTIDAQIVLQGINSRLSGFGRTESRIFNEGVIRVSGGVLSVGGPIESQSGSGSVIVASSIATPGQAVNELRGGSYVDGRVLIGSGSLLTGSSGFRDVDIQNNGEIRVGVFESISMINSNLSQSAAGRTEIRGDLRLLNSSLQGGVYDVIQRNTQPGLKGIELDNGTISDASVNLRSVQFGDLSFSEVNSARLIGEGTLNRVDLRLEPGSILDANVSGGVLRFNQADDNVISNQGTLRATRGVLSLNGGRLEGSGDLFAFGSGRIEISNVDIVGANFVTASGGVIIDLAQSTLRNFSNRGTFQVAGEVTLDGPAQNEGGEIEVLAGGAIIFDDDSPLMGGSLRVQDGGVLRAPGETTFLVGTTLGGRGAVEGSLALLDSILELNPSEGEGFSVSENFLLDMGSELVIHITDDNFEELGSTPGIGLEVAGSTTIDGLLSFMFAEEALFDMFLEQANLNDFLRFGEAFRLPELMLSGVVNGVETQLFASQAGRLGTTVSAPQTLALLVGVLALLRLRRCRS